MLPHQFSVLAYVLIIGFSATVSALTGAWWIVGTAVTAVVAWEIFGLLSFGVTTLHYAASPLSPWVMRRLPTETATQYAWHVGFMLAIYAGVGIVLAALFF